MLFTAASMYQRKCKTYLICSDAKEKDKCTVVAFMNYLFENELKPNSTEMKSVKDVIWMDGPSSEFKNQYTASFLKELSEKYNKPFLWKYFATSHGKGVVDGIGGRAKSIVCSAIMSKGRSAALVQNASDFYEVAAKLMPSDTHCRERHSKR